MNIGHGRLVMAVMAMVMASLACSVEWEGGQTSSPSMTVSPSITPSMTATYQPNTCLIVRALPNGDGSLNLRAGPGTGYGVRAVLADGQKMAMDGKSGDWYAVGVVMDGALLTGWVNKAYAEACEWR